MIKASQSQPENVFSKRFTILIIHIEVQDMDDIVRAQKWVSIKKQEKGLHAKTSLRKIRGVFLTTKD